MHCGMVRAHTPHGWLRLRESCGSLLPLHLRPGVGLQTLPLRLHRHFPLFVGVRGLLG